MDYKYHKICVIWLGIFVRILPDDGFHLAKLILSKLSFDECTLYAYDQIKRRCT